MSSNKKQYFKHRTVPQIRNLKTKEVYPTNIAGKVDQLQDDEALILKKGLIHPQFFRGVDTLDQAARKALKHGKVLYLPTPRTKRDALNSRKTMLDYRREAFKKLPNMREENWNFVSFGWRTNFGDDGLRVVPFSYNAAGMKLFTYALTQSSGIELKSFKDARIVRTDGTKVRARVPSRTKGKGKYSFSHKHVPCFMDQSALSIIMQLKPVQEVDEEGEIVTTRPENAEWDQIKYGFPNSHSGEGTLFFPHDVAAYAQMVRESGRRGRETAPIRMNPFIFFSQRGAKIFSRLENNVLVEEGKNSEKKLRPLYEVEKSIIMGRAPRDLGHDEIAYWEPARDGRFRDYEWNLRE